MGSAFSVPLADRGHRVNLVGTPYDRALIEGLQRGEPHPGLGVELRLESFTTDALPELLPITDVLVLAVSSLGTGWAAQQLAQHLGKPVPVLILTKGLAAHNGKLEPLSCQLRRELPSRLNVPFAALAGPCIAAELAARRETSVVLSAEKQATLGALLPLLETPYYHVWPSTDFVGTELCAALKNIYALAVGVAAGQRESLREPGGVGTHNHGSSLFTQALYEMRRLVEVSGGSPETVHGLAGAGDLYVTCQGGRNGRMGAYLGRGLSYSEAKREHMPHETVEGAELVKSLEPTLRTLNDTLGGRLPLLGCVLEVICKDAPVRVAWKRFFA